MCTGTVILLEPCPTTGFHTRVSSDWNWGNCGSGRDSKDCLTRLGSTVSAESVPERRPLGQKQRGCLLSSHLLLPSLKLGRTRSCLWSVPRCCRPTLVLRMQCKLGYIWFGFASVNQPSQLPQMRTLRAIS